MAIHHLSTKKSPGHDKIRAEYIKNEQCIHFLHTFFNTCFNSRKIHYSGLRVLSSPSPNVEALLKTHGLGKIEAA